MPAKRWSTAEDDISYLTSWNKSKQYKQDKHNITNLTSLAQTHLITKDAALLDLHAL